MYGGGYKSGAVDTRTFDPSNPIKYLGGGRFDIPGYEMFGDLIPVDTKSKSINGVPIDVWRASRELHYGPGSAGRPVEESIQSKMGLRGMLSDFEPKSGEASVMESKNVKTDPSKVSQIQNSEKRKKEGLSALLGGMGENKKLQGFDFEPRSQGADIGPSSAQSFLASLFGV